MVLLVALFGCVLPEPVTRSAVERSLPALNKAMAVHIEKKTCFACHNEGSTMLAVRRAAKHGFAIDGKLVAAVAEHTTDFLETHREKLEAGKGTGGGVDTVGWALSALHDAGHKPDDTTKAAVSYLLKAHADLGHWRPTNNRPPTQGSHFTSTYLAIRALQDYATDDQKETAEKRIAAAKGWIEKTPAKDNEDRVFKLFSLHATKAETKAAAKELLDTQRPDGGWSQLDGGESDAYATGSALVALCEAGGIAVDSPIYRKGIAFLLKTQKPDGTWHVKTRSKPIQPYYESGFPYEKDQFIACPASSWATAALVLGLK
jgi:hypothetical protein